MPLLQLSSIGVPNEEQHRRALRELLFTAPGVEDHISGVVGALCLLFTNAMQPQAPALPAAHRTCQDCCTAMAATDAEAPGMLLGEACGTTSCIDAVPRWT